MLIFRRIFPSNYWWQKFDISSQASYRYLISWEAIFDPSDSYFLFADLIGFYTHLTYMPYCGKHFWDPCMLIFVAFFSANIDGRNLIVCHKLHIGTPFCGKRFWTRQIPTSCLPTVYTFNIFAHFSSHFSEQLLMTGIWYLVTSFIYVPHQIHTSCLPTWLVLCTLNISTQFILFFLKQSIHHNRLIRTQFVLDTL